MNETRKLVFMGLLVAAALALSFVESFLPPLVLPGAKLGLANIVTVVALYALPRPRDAAMVLAARVLLGGVFAGGATLVYSASGAALSFCVMLLLQKAGRFGIVPVSAAGGFFHNAGQLVAASVTTSSSALALAYLPPLGGLGLLAGGFVGIVAREAVKKFSWAQAGM